ncbi:uncharacterized protein At2g39795, mitochondrial-like [Triticum dicoccoides]|uniref:uncharacterized protein At2g39795, mitochondrial-like n=1 Tax=Triticum dicoccoides TaxID=85692 RepID=UPI00188EF8EC|nr:uncharacterized protein At2g39795, mitochondrial-like [Triticum dicoccoides]
MAILAAARRASSLLLLRASCALLRPAASPLTPRSPCSSPYFDSAKMALLKAALDLDSIAAETGSSASAAAQHSLRAAADSLGASTFDDHLVRDIDSTIKSSTRPTKMQEAEGFFPFKIVRENRLLSSSSTLDITLGRTFEGEQIEIRAYTLGSHYHDNGIISLNVTVSKSNGSDLLFSCSAYADYITIDSMKMKGQLESHNGFDKLDKNLQKSFYKYLELRGITPTMAKLLHEYKRDSGPRTQHLWLNKLSDFIKKD